MPGIGFAQPPRLLHHPLEDRLKVAWGHADHAQNLRHRRLLSKRRPQFTLQPRDFGGIFPYLFGVRAATGRHARFRHRLLAGLVPGRLFDRSAVSAAAPLHVLSQDANLAAFAAAPEVAALYQAATGRVANSKQKIRSFEPKRQTPVRHCAASGDFGRGTKPAIRANSAIIILA